MKKLSFLFAVMILIGGCGMPRVDKTLIHGTVAPGFEEVYDEFVRNFDERKDLGAACAVYYKGESVVDLWGGYRDAEKRLPWEEDTMVMIFSSTKGLAMMAVAHAVSENLLDYDEKVSAYWPEFGTNGKENVTVRQLLNHEAGIPVTDEPILFSMWTNYDAVATVLAEQTPYWEPGDKHGYHTGTIGFLIQELIRRVDPEGRTLGQYFADEIASPLDLEFYIGLPEDISMDRIAKIKGITPISGMFNLGKVPKAMRKKIFDGKSYFNRAFTTGAPDINTREYLEVEQPAGNGVGTARSIAKAYGEFAMGGTNLGITPEVFAQICMSAEMPADGWADETLGFDTYYNLGYTKPGPDADFGTSRSAFGTPGAGGSFSFADPDKELGFSYVMTRMDFYATDDPREKSLRDAVYRCIEKLESAETNE